MKHYTETYIIVNTFYRIYTHFLCVGMYFFQYLTERSYTYIPTYIHIVLHSSKASYVSIEGGQAAKQTDNKLCKLEFLYSSHASWATMIFPISLATFTISSGLSCSASVDSSQSSAASQCRKKTLSVVVRQRAVHNFSFLNSVQMFVCFILGNYDFFDFTCNLQDLFRAQLFSFSRLQSVFSSFTVPKKDSDRRRLLEGRS